MAALLRYDVAVFGAIAHCPDQRRARRRSAEGGWKADRRAPCPPTVVAPGG